MSTEKSLKQLKSKDDFLIAYVSTYFEKHSGGGGGGAAHHIFNILFRQLGSAEEPFSEYEKNFEKPVHFRRHKVRKGDNTNLWMTLLRLLSETMYRSFTPTAISFRP